MDWWDIIDQFFTWNHLNRTIIGGDMNGYSQNGYQMGTWEGKGEPNFGSHPLH